MTSPTLTFDPEAQALYIRFSEHDVAETVELTETVYVDIDRDGEPVGFEILGAEPSRFAGVPVLPDAAALRDLVRLNAV